MKLELVLNKKGKVKDMKKYDVNKRIDVEYLRDMIRSDYDLHIDYDDYEQELMRDLEFDYITKEEFIDLLNEHYQELVELEKEEQEN